LSNIGLQSKLELYPHQKVLLTHGCTDELTKATLNKGLWVRIVGIADNHVNVVLCDDAVASQKPIEYVIKKHTATVNENGISGLSDKLLSNGCYDFSSNYSIRTLQNQAGRNRDQVFSVTRKQFPFSTKSVMMVTATRGLSLKNVIAVISGHNPNLIVLVGRSDNTVLAFPPESFEELDRLLCTGELWYQATFTLFPILTCPPSSSLSTFHLTTLETLRVYQWILGSSGKRLYKPTSKMVHLLLWSLRKNTWMCSKRPAFTTQGSMIIPKNLTLG